MISARSGQGVEEAVQARDESAVAAEVRDLAVRGEAVAARELFAEIVRRQQRRAARIAFHYLRDVADADEATQDAFLKAYVHIDSYRPEHSFEVWFTRILINGCLDRRKARQRRARWLLPVFDADRRDAGTINRTPAPSANPEQVLLARERWTRIARAVRRLPPQQRTVFILCAYAGHSTRETASITDLSESTVRVHFFRAVRKLRAALKDRHHVD